MRHFTALLLLTVPFLSCGNVDITRFSSYPDVMTVANKVDEQYHIMGSSSVYFSLAKKPKGWFVVRMDSKTLKPVSEELYWSVKSNSYEKISGRFFNSTESTGEIRKIKNEIGRDEYNFDHSIYFGYEGWENDVIDVLGSANNLNDTLLESLARAYGSKCLNLTRHEKDPVAARSGRISNEQVEEFCKYGNKDLETYKKLLEINSEYETMVGKAQTKLSNEYLFLWSELKQSGRNKEAEQYMVDGLYDDLMIIFAKNMLNSAEPNGIIFTNGDNDTYPLWYVQQKLEVRKDVVIMNTSLMNIPGWIFSGLDKNQFVLSFSDKFYENSMSDIIYLQSDHKNIFGLGTVKTGLESKDPSFVTKTSTGEEFFQLPFSNIRLSYLENDSLAPVADVTHSYLTKSDLAIFDIIASNLGKRPIYFAETAYSGTIAESLSRYLIMEGMLAHVVQGENHGTLFQDKYYDLASCYNKELTLYNYGLNSLKSFQVEPIAVNYIYDFHSLAAAFLESGDTIKAAEVATACEKKIPFAKFTEPVGPYLIGDDLCRAGKIVEGKKLLLMSFDRIKKLLPKQTDENELGRYSTILGLIGVDADKFGFIELARPCVELKKQVDEKLSKISEEKERKKN